MQRLKKEVPTADVVVTNPTHFAVALKYDQAKMRAPKSSPRAPISWPCASASWLPTPAFPSSSAALARAIYRMVEVGEEIPEELYAAVAEILAYVYELSGKQILAVRPAAGAVN